MGKRKKVLFIALPCLIALACVGGVFAWLSATGILANSFGIGSVEPVVEETLSGSVKSNVYLKNQGTTPAYLRANVDVHWQDDAGNQLWDEPVENVDYAIKWGSGVSDTAKENVWVKGSDGFWYWTSPVSPLGGTGQLIDEVSPAGDSEGKHLVVDISTQGIQSVPDAAVRDAWNCTVSNGVLTPPSR